MKFDVNLADLFKLPSKIMAALALASGLILFLPEALMEKMYMVNFRNNFGFAIGITFIVSLSILVVTTIAVFYKYSSKKRSSKKFKKEAPKLLQKLDDYQMAIIYGLYCEDNHTAELPLNDGAVRVLENYMMIGKATTNFLTDMTNPEFPFMLQPWVIEALKKDGELFSRFRLAYNRYKQRYEEATQRGGYNTW